MRRNRTPNKNNSDIIDWKEIEAPISAEDVEKSLKKLQGWHLANDTIEKTFGFDDFKQAIEFINKVAEIAAAENHHPDILLWNWNNVKLTITTHCIKGLSKKDFDLASKIDRMMQCQKIENPKSSGPN